MILFQDRFNHPLLANFLSSSSLTSSGIVILMMDFIARLTISAEARRANITTINTIIKISVYKLSVPKPQVD
ncbi:hypothetical protein D3C73_699700 [compost metagenome]